MKMGLWMIFSWTALKSFEAGVVLPLGSYWRLLAVSSLVLFDVNSGHAKRYLQQVSYWIRWSVSTKSHLKLSELSQNFMVIYIISLFLSCFRLVCKSSFFNRIKFHPLCLLGCSTRVSCNPLFFWQVEEARKKMFNGTISSVPQTLTVVAPQLNSPSAGSHSAHSSKPLQPGASVLQSLPCQILGRTSLVLTPVVNGSTVTCAPLALTVANQVENLIGGPLMENRTAAASLIHWISLVNLIQGEYSPWFPQVVQSLKRPLATPVISSESKRPSIIQTISAPTAKSKLASPKTLNFTVDPNKTAEQLSVLRSSYTQCPFPEEDEVRISEWKGFL